MSAFTIFVPMAATFVLVASAGACAIALAGQLPSRFLLRRMASSSAVRAAVVFAPMIFAAVGCVALAFPDPFVACHCDQHGLHHPHLCLSHPAFALPLVAPAAYALGAWLLVVAPRVLRLAREVTASARWAAKVRRLPALHLEGVTFRLADCGARSAITVGALSPLIAVDPRLWDALSPEARRAVLHHEQGHVERLDGLTLLALRLCAALYLLPSGRRALDAWRAAAEDACDLHAAAKLGDTGAVAAALIAVERARANDPAEALSHAVPALGIGAGGELERRVVALLNTDRVARPELLLGNDLLAASIITLGAALLALMWPGDTLHHAFETLVGAFFR